MLSNVRLETICILLRFESGFKTSIDGEVSKGYSCFVNMHKVIHTSGAEHSINQRPISKINY